MLFVHTGKDDRVDRVETDPALVDLADPSWHTVTETTYPTDTSISWGWDVARSDSGWVQIWARLTPDVVDGDVLQAKVEADIGPKLTGAETPDLLWPTVKTWRTLAKVARADVTTVSAVMQIVVWMVPACLRGVRLALKTYRLVTRKTGDDLAAN